MERVLQEADRSALSVMDWGWIAASYLGGMVTVFIVRPSAEWVARLFGR